MKIAALQQRRNQLAGYCKLVIYGVLELRSASDIFKYYSKVREGGVWGQLEICTGTLSFPFCFYSTGDGSLRQYKRKSGFPVVDTQIWTLKRRSHKQKILSL